MINFETYEPAFRDLSIASAMIDKDDKKQLIRFCQDGRCDNCLFNPKNFKERYGAAQSGCYRNKMEWLYMEAER